MSITIKGFNDIIENTPNVNILNYFITEFNKFGVRVKYEKGENYTEKRPTYKRFMFETFNRSYSSFFPAIIVTESNNYKNIKKCNKKTYKPISVSCAPPMARYKKSILYNHYPGEVEVIPAKDGTTITLYWYNGKWTISTHKGYEVNSYKWGAEGKTYKDVIDEVLKKYDFKYDKLDKNKSYSIGFKHSDFHPFNEGNESKMSKAWFIQSVDLKKFNNGQDDYINYKENIGIPIQETIKFSSLKELFKNADDAYSKFKETGEIT
jgi:hypothetical protein